MHVIFQFLVVICTVLTMSCATIPMKREGSKPLYKSQFNNKQGIIHGVNLKKMAKGAPLRIVAMVQSPIAPKNAWKAGLADVDKWSKGQITKVAFFEQPKNGSPVDWRKVKAGDFRHCLNPKEDFRLVEDIRYIDHKKKFYVYSVNFEHSNVPFPIANHTGAVTIESDGQGGSLLTFRAYFEKTWNPISWIFPTLFHSQFNQFMQEFAKVYGGDVVEAKFHQ